MNPISNQQAVEQAFEAYFSSMPADARERFAVNLDEYLSTTALGRVVKAQALNRRLGLGLFEAASTLPALLATLGTAALTVGVGLYDKQQDRKASAAADKREYAAQAAQLTALKDQAIAANQVRAVQGISYAKYIVMGVGGLGVLGLIGFIALRRPRRR